VRSSAHLGGCLFSCCKELVYYSDISAAEFLNPICVKKSNLEICMPNLLLMKEYVVRY